MLDGEKRLFLRLGDRVFNDEKEERGIGAVVEVMTSVVPGGTCLVRILFEDGKQRTFNNDMDSELCCRYLGLRKNWRFDLGGEQPRVGGGRAPRRSSQRQIGGR